MWNNLMIDPVEHKSATSEIVMTRMLILAAAASAALAGCMSSTDGGQSGMSSSMAMPADMTPEDRLSYVRMAGASDMFEIQSSQMALSRAQRADTRQYAQMLVTHHTQTTQATMQAAQAAGLNPPPPMLMSMQRRMLDQLRRASGASFDRLYFTQQVPAHEMALALHTNYSRSGDTPSLRATAASAIPIVQQHLDGARRMRGMM
jgi:putative membrane protein